MEMMDIVRIGTPILVTLGVVLLMAGIIIPEITEGIAISKSDKVCLKLEKIRYCNSLGMELGSIVITPSGLFGGSPYNKEACVTENSEKIIEFKELEWEKCKKQ